MSSPFGTFLNYEQVVEVKSLIANGFTNYEIRKRTLIGYQNIRKIRSGNWESDQQRRLELKRESEQRAIERQEYRERQKQARRQLSNSGQSPEHFESVEEAAQRSVREKLAAKRKRLGTDSRVTEHQSERVWPIG